MDNNIKISRKGLQDKIWDRVLSENTNDEYFVANIY